MDESQNTANPVTRDGPDDKFRSRARRSSRSRSSKECVVNIRRTPFTQAAFDELHLKAKMDKPSTMERLKGSCTCSGQKVGKLFMSYLPILNTIRYYQIKEFLLRDIIAGITIGILHIPQALAFGALASVKIENGLYTSIWPVILYVIFGTSPHVSMGTSAVICIVTGSVVDRHAEKFMSTHGHLRIDANNRTLAWEDVPEFMDFKENTAMGISFFTGIILLAMGFLKLGFITAYLSDSFFSAFTSGAAVHIATSQIPAIFGIKVKRYSGAFKIIKTYIAIFKTLVETNVASLIIAVLSGVAILLVKDCINERFKHKLPIPIPIELVVVIICTTVSYLANLSSNFGVAIVSSIPKTIPPPVLPVFFEPETYIADSFVIAILIFANTIAMAKICAKLHNYEVQDSQELVAYGMCNFVSAFFKCFPSSVAPPRSMVASGMNTKSTINGLFSAALLIMLTLVISGLFEPLPKSALAAIIAVALRGLFIQLKDCVKFWKVNKIDFVIWISTLSSVVFLDIDLGLCVGVVVSLLTVVFQAQFAKGYRVGQTLTDRAAVEHKRYKDSREIPGIEVYRFHSNIFFANAEIFRMALYRATINPRKLLKFIKKLEKKHKKENKEEPIVFDEHPIIQFRSTLKNQNENEKPEVELTSYLNVSETNKAKESPRLDETRNRNGTINSEDQSYAARSRSISFASLESFESADDSLDGIIDPEDGEEIVTEKRVERLRSIHHVIVDFGAVNYVDISGANVIAHIYNEYNHVNIKLFLANISFQVREILKHAGVFNTIPKENVFLDIYDAIVVAREAMVLPIPEEGLADFTFEEAAEDKFVTHIGK